MKGIQQSTFHKIIEITAMLKGFGVSLGIKMNLAAVICL